MTLREALEGSIDTATEVERLLYLLPREPGDQYPEDRATRMANEAILHLRPAVAAAIDGYKTRIDELVIALRDLVTAWDNHRTLTKRMEAARSVLIKALPTPPEGS